MEDLAAAAEEAGDEQNIIHACSDYRLKINMIFKYTMGKIYSTLFEDFLHYLFYYEEHAVLSIYSAR